MILNSGLRIFAFIVAPALFSVTVERNIAERPRLINIDPQKAAPGEIVSAHGVNLDRALVAELLLEGGGGTTITHITEQRADLLRFRVPTMLEPGEYRIVLVADRRSGTKVLDQNIVLTIVNANGTVLLSSR